MNRIRKLRIDKNITQEELGEIVNVQKSAISKYELGRAVPSYDVLKKLADFFSVSVDYLICNDQNALIASNVNGVKIPILGSVVAGVPVSAVTDIVGYEEITPQLAAQGKHFALQIKGDSMYPELKDGDIVIVREQKDCDSGDIAIVLVNGDEATCKQIKKTSEGLMLIGFNMSVYQPHFYTNKEIEELPVCVIGKVIESRRTW